MRCPKCGCFTADTWRINVGLWDNRGPQILCSGCAGPILRERRQQEERAFIAAVTAELGLRIGTALAECHP
jgi:hypothetical protein